MRHSVSLIAMVLVVGLPTVGFSANRQAFLKKHCSDCHGADLQEAGLRLDRLSGDLAQPDLFARWVLIYDRVRKGEMPPDGIAKKDASEKATFLRELRDDLLASERKKEAHAKAQLRRMNRTEYERTLQDLLALPLLRVKEMLPEDGQQHGFDKVPDALELSHVQMKKYLEVADRALRQAVVRKVAPPRKQAWWQKAVGQWTARGAIATHNAAPVTDGKLAPGLRTLVRGNPVDDPGNTYRAATFAGEADSLVVFSSRLGAHQPQGIQPDRFRPTVGGWYRVRFSIWGLRWERGKVKPAIRSKIRKYIEFSKPWKRDKTQRWKGTRLARERVQEVEENVAFYGHAKVVHVVRASLKGKPLGFFDAPSLKPTTHEFKVWLEPGERVSFHVMSLPTNGPRNSASSNGVLSYEGPAVAFDWFEIEGPILETWPPQSQQRLFGKTPIGAFPRPLVPGLPMVEAGKSLHLPITAFTGAGQKVGKVWYLNVAGSISTRVNFAVPGTYECKVTAAETPAGDEAARMRLLLNGSPIPHGKFSVTAPQNKPQTYRKTFAIDSAGPATIGIEFLNDFFDEKTRADRNLLISDFEITAIKPDKESKKTPTPDIQTLLCQFADRAFRRPVKPAEMKPYVAIVQQQLQAGESFEEAMIAGYKALLCSPDFLFLGLEGDYALASRLSYFLWNSMPDAELRRLAGSGELARPNTLLAQVRRMLADPRSDRFIEHFLDQWLEMKNIDFTTPDPQLYPEFDSWLRDSMLAETRAYFRKLITDNLGIRYLIDSDFLVINQRLAEHYGIRGVAGSKMRAVRIPEGSLRGGVLAQAAVLKVTANGTATSPVLRGVWITERILGIPRRPPPPNIPAVEPDATGAITIREQIEKHRADPACARCHRVIDPPGLALESFDVIGGWRDRYRASGRPRRVGRGKNRKLEPHISLLTSRGKRKMIRLGGKVDPSGQLPGGQRFADVEDFRKLLLANREQLARNLARQFTIYATGKGYRFSDRQVIDAMIARSKTSHYGVRSLIEAVVLSPLFRHQD